MEQAYRLDKLNIRNAQHLAQRVDVPEEILFRLAESPEQEYLPERTEPKKSGGVRYINPPKLLLKSVQRKINRLLQEIKLPNTFYGAVKNRSNIDNAKQHINQRCVARFDIKDFFPSISYGRVKSFFVCSGCTPPIAKLLAKLTTLKNRLPQGAPTSSTLANLILARHERRFRNLAMQFGLKVTFFQDDIGFSGGMDISRIEKLIPKILSQIGFEAHEKKTEIRQAHQRQTMTGLVVNRGVNRSKDDFRKLRAAIHSVKSCQNINSINVESLKGKIDYLRRINPLKGNKLMDRLQKNIEEIKARNFEDASLNSA